MLINALRVLLMRLPDVRGRQRLFMILDSLFGPLPVQSRAGGRLLLYPSSVQDSYFWKQAEENNKILAAQINSLPADAVFVDIGSNSGFYSLMAASKLGERGVVVSIEPSGRELSRLFWAKSKNRYQCRWEALNVAIGSGGLARLDIQVGHTGMNRILDDSSVAACVNSVGSVRLADALNLYGITKIDLLKIDVEGYELRVLSSCKELLVSGCIGAIVCEITDSFLAIFGDSVNRLYGFMEDVGYSWQKGPRFGEWQYDELFLKCSDRP